MRFSLLIRLSSLRKSLLRTIRPTKGLGSIWRKSSSLCFRTSVSTDVSRRSTPYAGKCWLGLTNAIATAKRYIGDLHKKTLETHSNDTTVRYRNLIERPLRHRVEVLMAHILKWKTQPPGTKSWR